MTSSSSIAKPSKKPQTIGSPVGLTALSGATVGAATGASEVSWVHSRSAARSFAADGSLLSAPFEEDRVPVPLQAIAPVFVDAVIAVEDSSFYQLGGVSVRGPMGAAMAHVSPTDFSAPPIPRCGRPATGSVLHRHRCHPAPRSPASRPGGAGGRRAGHSGAGGHRSDASADGDYVDDVATAEAAPAELRRPTPKATIAATRKDMIEALVHDGGEKPRSCWRSIQKCCHDATRPGLISW